MHWSIVHVIESLHCASLVHAIAGASWPTSSGAVPMSPCVAASCVSEARVQPAAPISAAIDHNKNKRMSKSVRGPARRGQRAVIDSRSSA